MNTTHEHDQAPILPNAMERLQGVTNRLQARRDVIFMCSPIARVMRRDWTLVSYRITHATRYPEWNMRLQESLREMEFQAEELSNQVALPLFQTLSTEWLAPVSMRFPILHRHMSQLLRNFELVDQSYALLLAATREGLITRERQRQLLSPIIYVYGTFKSAAMQQTAPTSGEAEWD